MVKRQVAASLTFVEARINLRSRTKSARTTSFGIFQGPQSTSMKSATFSKPPSRLTSHLYASLVLWYQTGPVISFCGDIGRANAPVVFRHVVFCFGPITPV
jgi:hypothetical protein